jgi:hypothetical protein
MLYNWLPRIPGQIVIIEPFLFANAYLTMLHRQFAELGIAAMPDEWA